MYIYQALAGKTKISPKNILNVARAGNVRPYQIEIRLMWNMEFAESRSYRSIYDRIRINESFPIPSDHLVAEPYFADYGSF